MIIRIEKALDRFEPWAGAVDTFEKLAELDLLDDLEGILEEMYPDGIDETTLNDILWFEPEWIFEMLGVEEEEEEEEGGK